MTLLDDLYPFAVNAVMEAGKPSTSYVQRQLKIGYNMAAALIERMEAAGLISPADHTGKRDILATQPGSSAPVYGGGGPRSGGGGGGSASGVSPWTDDSAPVDETPAPSPPDNDPEPEGEPRTFICSGCDAEETSTRDLPRGWWTQTSPRLGVILRCPACSRANATRIATEHYTTEQILNAGSDGAEVDVITGAAQTRLKTFIQRGQRLREDARALQADLKELMDEAKGEGFDVKILRKVLTYIEKDKVKREEEDAVFDLYLTSIGER
ncbi:MAG: DNA translocase FtsK [Asticcacaulis sp.]|uniref:DNA translocase FtsK n=1 Tax=Asticcacaulis sp. TaxID=1872648 RepID=UPI003F7C1921